MLASKPAPHVPKGIVSDWTQHHVLYPDSQDESVMARFRRDPRWEQNWYLRHREAWWPEYHPEAGSPDEDSEREWRREHRRRPHVPGEESHRDWSVALGTAAFQPTIDFSFTISTRDGIRFSERDRSGRRYVAGHLRQSYRDRRERRGDVHAHSRRAGGNDQPTRQLSLRQCDYPVHESGARCRWTSVWSCRKRTQRLGEQRKQLFLLR